MKLPHTPTRQVNLALETLGKNLRRARLRRALTVQQAAETVIVSPDTYRRMELGDYRVAMGTYAAALAMFDMTKGLFSLASPAADIEGEILEAKQLPKRAKRASTGKRRTASEAVKRSNEHANVHANEQTSKQANEQALRLPEIVKPKIKVKASRQGEN